MFRCWMFHVVCRFIVTFRKRFGFHELSGKCFSQLFATRRPMFSNATMLHLIMIEGATLLAERFARAANLKSIKYNPLRDVTIVTPRCDFQFLHWEFQSIDHPNWVTHDSRACPYEYLWLIIVPRILRSVLRTRNVDWHREIIKVRDQIFLASYNFRRKMQKVM